MSKKSTQDKSYKDKIYINGLYVISAIIVGDRRSKKKLRLHGHIVDINTPSKRVSGSVYTIGSYVNFPLYHTEKSTEPQFKTLVEVRENKINTLLDD